MLCIYSSSILRAQTDEQSIQRIIVDFLNWHNTQEHDMVNNNFKVVRYAPYTKKLERIKLVSSGVEKRLAFYRQSNFLSNSFINNLRGNFLDIGELLHKSPPVPKGERIRIPGLDLDMILQGYEPELVLDFIDKGQFKKISVLSNKSIAQFYIPDTQIVVVFTLSKFHDNWLIDSIDYDHELGAELSKPQ